MSMNEAVSGGRPWSSLMLEVGKNLGGRVVTWSDEPIPGERDRRKVVVRYTACAVALELLRSDYWAFAKAAFSDIEDLRNECQIMGLSFAEAEDTPPYGLDRPAAKIVPRSDGGLTLQWPPEEV